MKNLSQISDNKDIITKEYLVAGYEPLLPATPLEPATKYLNGLRQWSSITIGSGGYAANLYGTNFTSTIVPAYYQMSYTADQTETVVQITRNTPGETMGGVYLFEQPIGVSTIDEGAWKFSWTGKINSTAGNTRLRFEIFVRTSGGTETALFSVTTDYLKDVDFTYNTLESVQPIYTVNTTDRLGVKTYLSTTNAASITGSLIVGGTRSAYMNTPLALRHTQLRGLNDDTNNVHVTSTERTNLTAVTALSTTGFIKRTGSGTYTIDTSTYSLSTHNHNGTYQAADADLTAIAALAGTSGLLKKTAANTWSLDTSTYSLSTHNHSGVYQPIDADLTAIAALAGTSGLLRKTAVNTWTLDTTALGDMTVAIYGGSTSGVVAKSDALKETRAGATEKVWVGTKAQYTAIVTKDSGTCYITTDETYGSYISLDETGHILASYMPSSVSAHIASTSNPHGVTKSQVGLGNVNNTADIDKPISLYVQNALDGKAALNHTHSTYAPINNPTFTGTVSGITATMIGLGNVTNENKTTMFTNPTFTGTVSGITATMIGLGNVTNESKTTMFTSPTFTGIAKATGNTSYTTSQLRNIFFNTAAPTSGDGSNGDIWIIYT